MSESFYELKGTFIGGCEVLNGMLQDVFFHNTSIINVLEYAQSNSKLQGVVYAFRVPNDQEVFCCKEIGSKVDDGVYNLDVLDLEVAEDIWCEFYEMCRSRTNMSPDAISEAFRFRYQFPLLDDESKEKLNVSISKDCYEKGE